MTVEELIARLSALPLKAQVRVMYEDSDNPGVFHVVPIDRIYKTLCNNTDTINLDTTSPS